MPEEDADVMWTFSKAESAALETLCWLTGSFFFVYLMVTLVVPVLASFRLV